MHKFSSAYFNLLLVIPAVVGLIPTTQFFPYGPQNGDLRVPTADDNFVEFNLTRGNTYHFFNRNYDKLFINNNGGISFVRGVPEYTPNCGPGSVPMIVPYWADVNTILGGDVWYRETTTDAMIKFRAKVETERAFPGLQVNPSWVFIATWDNVPFFGASTTCNGLSLRNTFQTVLVTDGTLSYAIFNFNNITWTTGTASGGDCFGKGGIPAKSGFDLGDGQTFFGLPGSCGSDVYKVPNTTNVNQDGKWIFRTDVNLQSSPLGNFTVRPMPINGSFPNATTGAPNTTNWGAPNTTTVRPSFLNGTNGSMACSPDDCSHRGYCDEYTFCNHGTLRRERQRCSDGLFWNPNYGSNYTGNNSNGTGYNYAARYTRQSSNATYGTYNATYSDDCTGSCDVWDNLSDYQKNVYRSDPQCFPACYYQELERCSSNYMYHPHNSNKRVVQFKTCPVDRRNGRFIPLVWAQDRETCDFCYNVRRFDGMPCCGNYDSGNTTTALFLPIPQAYIPSTGRK